MLDLPSGALPVVPPEPSGALLVFLHGAGDSARDSARDSLARQHTVRQDLAAALAWWLG